mmetsp:Transcript_20709/g.70432  ORF Transcript_20709/g.70432 Transcript_20709/m.70432 type:complete len:235 (-) Transcript_20709:106-810(-)
MRLTAVAMRTTIRSLTWSCTWVCTRCRLSSFRRSSNALQIFSMSPFAWRYSTSRFLRTFSRSSITAASFASYSFSLLSSSSLISACGLSIHGSRTTSSMARVLRSSVPFIMSISARWLALSLAALALASASTRRRSSSAACSSSDSTRSAATSSSFTSSTLVGTSLAVTPTVAGSSSTPSSLKISTIRSRFSEIRSMSATLRARASLHRPLKSSCIARDSAASSTTCVTRLCGV